MNRALRAAALSLLALASLSAPAARAGDQIVAKPRHGHSRPEWLRFVNDTLPEVVEGRTFEWEGRSYEVVRVATILRASTTKWAPHQRNEQVVHRGYVVARVHVKVDGRLITANVEGTANYVTFPEGWEWDKVLLYLGRNVSFDLVADELG
jgi:hypothetical protein